MLGSYGDDRRKQIQENTAHDDEDEKYELERLCLHIALAESTPRQLEKMIVVRSQFGADRGHGELGSLSGEFQRVGYLGTDEPWKVRSAMIRRCGLCALFLAAGAASGCARMTSDVAKRATPQVVESGLESATTPESKERIRELLSETPVKASVAQIEPAVIDATLARLAAEANRKYLADVTKVVARSLVEEIVRPEDPKMSRAQDAMVQRTVEIAVKAAIEEMRRDLPNLIVEMANNEKVRGALKPIGQTAGEGAVHGAVEEVTGKASKAP